MDDDPGDPEIVISDDDDGAPGAPQPGKRKAGNAPAAKAPAKRVRLERDRSAQKSNAQAGASLEDTARPDNAHDRFWYADGTLAIEVDDVQFNLYRGRMTAQSAYLAERLRDEPDSGTKARPLLLDNVTADDFEELLDLLESLWTTQRETKRATVMVAIIRAARALECREQRSWAWKGLVKLWPRDLPKPSARPTHDETLEIILLIRSVHPVLANSGPILLPRAYYELISAGPGTWGKKLRIRLPGDTAFAMKTELPLEIRRALSTARDFMQTAWLECLREGARMDCADGSQGCGGESATQCKKVGWFELVVATGSVAMGLDDPVHGIEMLVDMRWRDHKWCEKCVSRNEQFWRGKLEMVWDRMSELARM